MSTMTATPSVQILGPTRSAAAASRAAFNALLLRDLTVLRKNLGFFIARTLVQPFLLVFVFLYVFPQIGEGVGGSSAGGLSSFATILVAGVVGLSIMFQGIQAVALPLANEFGYTKEIEDRVLAPLPVSLVAIGKVVAGAVQGLHCCGHRLPHRFGYSCPWCATEPVGALATPAHSHPSDLRHDLQSRPITWDLHLPPQYRRHVRVHRPAYNLPRWHLLPMGNAGGYQGRGLPLATGSGLRQPAYLCD